MSHVTHDDSLAEAASQSPSRRSALKTLIAGVLVWPVLSDAAVAALAAAQQTGQPTTLAFLTPAQFAAVDALAEAIIPADAHSPGARAARVAEVPSTCCSASPTLRCSVPGPKGSWRWSRSASSGSARHSRGRQLISRPPCSPRSAATRRRRRPRPRRVLQGHEGRDHPGLLHVGHRHPQGPSRTRATSCSPSSSAARTPSTATCRRAPDASASPPSSRRRFV